MADRVPIDWANRPELIEALRHRADPAADEVVEAFDESDAAMGREALVHETMKHVAGPPESPDAAMIDAFLKDQPDWPEWADPGLVRAGQRFFTDHQWCLHLAFLLGSLPMSYCGASGALVLARTGHLNDRPRRRVFETATLMLELAEDGELAKGGSAYLMLRRLRLLHAVVRRVIEHHRLDVRRPGADVAWDQSVHGRPVNQLELLGTLWTFAVTSLDVLDRSGVDLDDEERAGWIHLWSLVGHLLGVAAPDDPTIPLGPGESLLPMDEAEARACFCAIQEAEFRASEEGRLLTRNLLDLVRELMPGRCIDRIVDGSVRLYLTDEWADVVGVPPVDVRRVFRPVQWAWRNPGGWARSIRRPVRRRLDGLHRNLMKELAERLGREDVPTLREDAADDLLRRHLERLSADATRGWGPLPQPEECRRTQR